MFEKVIYFQQLRLSAERFILYSAEILQPELCRRKYVPAECVRVGELPCVAGRGA